MAKTTDRLTIDGEDYLVQDTALGGEVSDLKSAINYNLPNKNIFVNNNGCLIGESIIKTVVSVGSSVAVGSEIFVIFADNIPITPNQEFSVFVGAYSALLRNSAFGDFRIRIIGRDSDGTQRQNKYGDTNSNSVKGVALTTNTIVKMTIGLSIKVAIKADATYDETFTLNYLYATKSTAMLDLDLVGVPGLSGIAEDAAMVADYVGETHNLCDVTKCKDNKSITLDSGREGEEVSSNSYWCTDYIELDANAGYYIVNVDGVYRTVFYDTSRAYLSSNPSKVDNMYPIPSTAKYVRIVFAKNKTGGGTNNAAPFDLHKALVVCYPWYSMSFIPHNSIEDDKYTIHDPSIFTLGTIIDFASNKANKQFTTSFEFDVPRGVDSDKNMIITADAMWTGTNAPTIQFSYPINLRYNYSDGSNLCISPAYIIGKKGGFDHKQWRMPPFSPNAGFMRISVTIPSGTTLTIKSIKNSYTDEITRVESAIRLNAHQGFNKPLDTLRSFSMAARCGFQACITIPKRTSDGVWVCFHDDDIIGRYARNDDGTNLSEPAYSTPISGFTYQQLLQYDFGQYNTYWNGAYKGERIPTLAEFFEICAKTGMHPMLSCHPEYSSSEWAEIYALAKKYNVLKTLNLKAAPGSLLTPAYNIMGTEIESYTVDVSTDRDATEGVIALGFDLTKVRVGIEYEYTYINSTRIANALAAGLFVASFNVPAEAAVYESLIQQGVTEFTEDYNCSSGLNW